ncbi:50S ribosomal protein L7ae-like protein [Caldibacillus lycopersici]|uniref:50S ribosomal protein L7ae-like protein n=1 Tax=Perspicuibacillus lycopersici TaxID=1325689 RepID=A0AAE3LNY5_9BACI|nr:50S ribosomal protein L7ae-like protein [Perspicuibacillus lycopersici]MCU9615235.1 50S ribosomal protein L7ae-like protein [Perspicuibacillus lycopersici]
MSYEKVKQAKNKKIGTKQSVKALKSGKAEEVFIASDADSKIVKAVIDTAKQVNIPITYVESMKDLGKACGIEVGAATVVLVY